MKRVFNIITLVLLLFVTAAGVSGIIQKYVYKASVVKYFGYGSAVVVSGSMSGAIEIDDVVVSREADSYAVGDVIIFTGSSGSAITHRIVAVNEDGSYVTKGDANNVADMDAVPPEAVEGKVVSVIRGGGRVTSFLQSPTGLIVVAVVLLIISELPHLADAVRSRTKRKEAEYEAEQQQS